MVGEFCLKRIGDLGKVITGKTPPTSNPNNFGGPYPFITIPDLDQRRDIISSIRTVSELGAAKQKTALLPAGAVMMSCIATIGRCGITTKPSFTNQQINSLICNDTAIPKFVYYCFTQLKSSLEDAGGGGSVYTNVSKTRFEDLKVPLPPLPEQKAIAAILGALDDKIELNRRMNSTLEDMARTLFKSWFVDFDPVKAKQQGQQPFDMDAQTAALFPDSFEESELGLIPKGWKVSPVGEVIECLGGGTPSTSEPAYWQNGMNSWTTPKDFSSLTSPVLINTERKITDLGLTRISSGLLPKGTALLSSRAPVGYLAISAIEIAINQGFIAMKPSHRASSFYILNWCQSNMDEIKSRATGTTFAEISKKSFRPISMLVPSVKIMEAHTSAVANHYEHITGSLYQSSTLATIRDTLLPKLLSGAIRVKDAEKVVSNVI